MTQKSAAKPHSDASAKVVVFGVDDDFKPHAAWFPKSQIEPARAAAKQLRLNLIEVTNGTATDLVAKLPAGRIHAPGSGMVPTVGRDLYEQIVATINPRGEAGQDTGASAVTALPADWRQAHPSHAGLPSLRKVHRACDSCRPAQPQSLLTSATTYWLGLLAKAARGAA